MDEISYAYMTSGEAIDQLTFYDLLSIVLTAMWYTQKTIPLQTKHVLENFSKLSEQTV